MRIDFFELLIMVFRYEICLRGKLIVVNSLTESEQQKKKKRTVRVAKFLYAKQLTL